MSDTLLSAEDARLQLIAVGMDLDLPFLLQEFGLHLAGYISNATFPCRETHLGGLDKLPNWISRKDTAFIIAAYEPHIKLAGEQEILQRSGQIRTIVAPGAKIAPSARIGAGSIIQHGAYIGDGASIGRCVKINVNTSVHHGSMVGDYSTINPSCTILGECKVGANVIIGASSTVRNHLEIGDNSIVGMGSVVVKDIPGGSVCYGVPAKRMGNFEVRSAKLR